MSQETALKSLHDEIVYFVNKNRGSLSPRSLSEDLKGWPDLLFDITGEAPEQITFEQLQKLKDFDRVLCDITRSNLGLQPMVVSDYRNANFTQKISAVLNKHPQNVAYTKLQNFYLDHIAPMQEAMHAVTQLDPFGDGYTRSNQAIANFRGFIEALKKLDTNSSQVPPPYKNLGYEPNLAALMQGLDTGGSPLRDNGFKEAIKLIQNLEITLGPPVVVPHQPARMSFGNHASLLVRAEGEWAGVLEEITKLKKTQALRRP